MRHYSAAIGAWWRMAGLRATLCWLLCRLERAIGISSTKLLYLRSKRAQYTLATRLGNSSDIEVFRQIFVDEEYSSLRDLEDVRFILDLGANVGYSSSYFLSCFPDARIVAVEPDERNLEICCLNLKPYGERVRVLHGAVWDRRTKLCLSRGTFGDGREWATEVALPPCSCSGDVQAWDICSLIDIAGCTKVDLLKIDIEGSELAVFSSGTKCWLPKVRNLCIELHGIKCQNAFFSALDGIDYELEYSGELTILRNMRPAL